MRIFKTKWLARFARREQISDEDLSLAVARTERGIVDADLGGGLLKQRVARRGQGRSSGYRMIVAYKQGERAVFLYGFAKNERDDVGTDELQSFREIALVWLAFDNAEIRARIETGAVMEIQYGERNE